MKETFDITGMTCAACSARVGKAAGGCAGVEEANVNLLKNSMELVYDGSPSTVEAVVKAIEREGYGATPRSARSASAPGAAAASTAASRSRPTTSRPRPSRRSASSLS